MTDRLQGISGTEIAGLFNMSPWCSRFSIYAKKKGLVPDDEKPTQRMRLGKMLEPVVVKCFEEETNLPVKWADQLIEHPKDKRIIGTPDGYIGDDAVFEAKTAGLDRAFEWGTEGDQIPSHYLFQVHYYMLLTGRKKAHLGALLGGNEFRKFEVPADEELQATMLDEVRRFWVDHVEKGVAPEIDASPAAKKYLLARYPSPTEGIRDATHDEDELVMGYIRTRDELKFLEERKETLANKLKDAIGGAKGINSLNGRVTWTYIPPTTVQAFERAATRRLSVVGKRGES